MKKTIISILVLASAFTIPAIQVSAEEIIGAESAEDIVTTDISTREQYGKIK